jgi:hypothetical protein
MTLRGVRLALVIAAVAASLVSCRLFMTRGILIRTPGHLDIVESSPEQIYGQTWGGSWGSGSIEVRRDGALFVGEASRDSDDPTRWVVPVEEPIPTGVHRLVASRSTGSGGIETGITFAISSNPFELAFEPPSLSTASGPPLWVGLAILGPSRTDQVDVRLSVVDAAGLILESDPPDLLPRSGQGASLSARTSIPIAVRAPLGSEPGAHYVRVQAEGPAGTQPRVALLTVRVPPDEAASPPTGPVEPLVADYQIASRLIGRGSGGEGRARVRWRMTFDCADGRCDAEVRDGGPRGGLAFVARYQANSRVYRFKGSDDLPRSDCRQLYDGTVEPTRWDGDGPVRFDYRIEFRLACPDRTRTIQTWEGSGRRQ